MARVSQAEAAEGWSQTNNDMTHNDTTTTTTTTNNDNHTTNNNNKWSQTNAWGESHSLFNAADA